MWSDNEEESEYIGTSLSEQVVHRTEGGRRLEARGDRGVEIMMNGREGLLMDLVSDVVSKK